MKKLLFSALFLCFPVHAQISVVLDSSDGRSMGQVVLRLIAQEICT